MNMSHFPKVLVGGKNDVSIFPQVILEGKMIHPVFPKKSTWGKNDSSIFPQVTGNERVGILSLCKRPGGISSIDERIVEWKRIGARHEEDNARFKSFGT